MFVIFELEMFVVLFVVEDDYGFGMMLIWEEDVFEEGVVEVYLGEVEGVIFVFDV